MEEEGRTAMQLVWAAVVIGFVQIAIGVRYRAKPLPVSVVSSTLLPTHYVDADISETKILAVIAKNCIAKRTAKI